MGDANVSHRRDGEDVAGDNRLCLARFCHYPELLVHSARFKAVVVGQRLWQGDASVHLSKRLLLVQLDHAQLETPTLLTADRRALAPARGHVSESSACALTRFNAALAVVLALLPLLLLLLLLELSLTLSTASRQPTPR